MTSTLNTLIKRQERNIFMIKQRILFSSKAKCPACHSKVILQHIAKSQVLCFFCANCQLLFEK